MKEIKETYIDYRDPLIISEVLINKQKRLEQHKINESKKHIEFTRLIFFESSEYMEITTFEHKDIQVDFIASDTCQYNIKDNVVYINDYKDKHIEINFDERNSTVIYCKAGYLNPIICHLLNVFCKENFLVLNDPTNVEISSNKYLTAKVLEDAGINQPKYCLVKYEDCDIKDDKEFEKKLKTIYGDLKEDNKYVCKILDGHGGNGVFICTKKNILSILQCIFSLDKSREILIQQALKIKEGDIRVYVLTYNGKQEIVECITRKKNSKDFRTNICLGSTFEKFELTKEQKDFAKNAALCSGLSFAGIDMCVDENTGKLNIIEINGSPGAPVALNIDKEENHKQHIEYYTNFINILIKIING